MTGGGPADGFANPDLRGALRDVIFNSVTTTYAGDDGPQASQEMVQPHTGPTPMSRPSSLFSMRNSRRWNKAAVPPTATLWLPVAAFAVLTLAAGLFPCASARGDEGAPSAVIRMGDVTMKVPAPYMFGAAGPDGRDGTGVNFRIRVLLPDMEPQTHANANEFERLGWGRELMASVYYKGLSTTGLTLFNIEMGTAEHYVKGTDHSGPFNITRLEYKTDAQVVFTGTRDQPGYFAHCDGPGYPSPSCDRTILIANDIYVHYYFSRSFLGDYAGIEQRLLALLNSFRTTGKPFEVIQ